LTFWPGFNPVTVAFAEFLFVEVLGFAVTTAFDGTFAAAAFAAVATFAATVAFAGTGIETNNPEISVAITIETIFDRAALTFMRTKSRITFTSLLE
jgi:hypothetical protein